MSCVTVSHLATSEHSLDLYALVNCGALANGAVEKSLTYFLHSCVSLFGLLETLCNRSMKNATNTIVTLQRIPAVCSCVEPPFEVA